MQNPGCFVRYGGMHETLGRPWFCSGRQVYSRLLPCWNRRLPFPYSRKVAPLPSYFLPSMPLTVWQVPVNPVESQRSGGWNSLRCRFLAKNPECACCGKTTELEAHHVVPVHVDKARELDEENLICLCERCHLVVGHLNSWFRYNKHIREDAALLKSRHREL